GRVPDDRSGGKRAEIAVAERFGRHGLNDRHAPNPLVLPLIIAEEEGAILDDWAAERAPELVLDRVRNMDLSVRAAIQLEIVARLECAVVVEFEQAAVKFIRSGPRRDVDHSADSAPEFGVII